MTSAVQLGMFAFSALAAACGLGLYVWDCIRAHRHGGGGGDVDGRSSGFESVSLRPESWQDRAHLAGTRGSCDSFPAAPTRPYNLVDDEHAFRELLR